MGMPLSSADSRFAFEYGPRFWEELPTCGSALSGKPGLKWAAPPLLIWLRLLSELSLICLLSKDRSAEAAPEVLPIEYSSDVLVRLLGTFIGVDDGTAVKYLDSIQAAFDTLTYSPRLLSMTWANSIMPAELASNEAKQGLQVSCGRHQIMKRSKKACPQSR